MGLSAVVATNKAMTVFLVITSATRNAPLGEIVSQAAAEASHIFVPLTLETPPGVWHVELDRKVQPSTLNCFWMRNEIRSGKQSRCYFFSFPVHMPHEDYIFFKFPDALQDSGESLWKKMTPSDWFIVAWGEHKIAAQGTEVRTQQGTHCG